MAKIFVSFTIVSTGNFFLVARENLNPLAEVYRSPAPLTPPHTQRNVTIDGINPVVHRVELWSTLDNLTLNQLRGRADIDASQYTSMAFDAFDFVVDRGFTGAPNYDPVSTPGSNTEYVNPDLASKTYLVFKPGFGPLLWGAHIEKRTVSGVDQGGFRYINGQEFAPGEEYTVMVSNLSTVQTPSSVNGYPDGIETLSTSIDFSSTYYRKLLEVIATSNITLNIVDINTIPDNTVFGINTHNLPNTVFKYITLQLPSGKYCLVNGKQRNAVYIGRAESVSFIKKGAYLRILNWDGDYRRVGQRVYSDNTAPFNSLPLLGGWILKSEYIRLWEWYVNELPAGDFITGADDSDPNPNYQKWIIGDTKIWIPDHGGFFYRNKAVNNAVDPDGTTRVWNASQGSQNKLHNHKSPGAWDKMSARASDVGGYGTPSGIDSTNPSTEYRVGSVTAGEFEDARLKDEGGSEARPVNLAAAIYVII